MQGGEEHPLPEFLLQGAGFIQNYSTVNLENHGREADSYAQHIILRYDSLAYTVFSQARLLEPLKSPPPPLFPLSLLTSTSEHGVTLGE